MQFVSEKSKLYGKALQLSAPQRYGVTCAVLGIMCIIWYFGVFQRIHAVSESQFNVRTAQLNQISQRNRDKKRLVELNKKMNETENNIGIIGGAHSQSDLFQSDIVNLISSGIKLRSYAPGELKTKQLYDKETIQLSFDATTNLVCNFFDNLQRSGNVLRCKQCVITCNNDTNIHACSCTIERIRLKKAVENKSPSTRES